MAAKENTKTDAQIATESAEKVIGYKVTGDRFDSKNEADLAVEEAHKKGFRSAGLCVRGSEFVILFGSYDTAPIARANLEAIKKAGFSANIENVTE